VQVNVVINRKFIIWLVHAPQRLAPLVLGGARQTQSSHCLPEDVALEIPNDRSVMATEKANDDEFTLKHWNP